MPSWWSVCSKQIFLVVMGLEWRVNFKKPSTSLFVVRFILETINKTSEAF